MNWGNSICWLMFGLPGQAAFTSSFLVQWIASEHAGLSVVPVAFWYLSPAGSVTLLVYAIHRLDPVFVLRQSAGGIVYLRNLVLLQRQEVGGTP